VTLKLADEDVSSRAQLVLDNTGTHHYRYNHALAVSGDSRDEAADAGLKSFIRDTVYHSVPATSTNTTASTSTVDKITEKFGEHTKLSLEEQLIESRLKSQRKLYNNLHGQAMTKYILPDHRKPYYENVVSMDLSKSPPKGMSKHYWFMLTKVLVLSNSCAVFCI
jgi:hypothetical protein